MVKKIDKKTVGRVKDLLNGYRLPHGYEIVVRKTAAAATRAAIAKAEKRRKQKPTKKTGGHRRRDSKGRFT